MHEQLTFKSTFRVYAHVYAWELTFKSTSKVYAQEINLQRTSKYMHEKIDA